MTARYRVNQLNRVHDRMVIANLDRILVGQSPDAMGLPPTFKLEFTPETSPAIGAVIVVTAEAVRSEGKAVA